MGQTAYLPAIANDVAAGGSEAKALAQEIDAAHHGGMPPYAAYVARTIFMHTLAFNDPLKGVSAERLRYSVLGPATDISFIDQARKRFVTDSAYLDDRPGAPMRFLAEANLRQIIRREEQHVDAGDARAELNDRIRRIFAGKTFEAISFPGGPFDVPDEVGDGRPRLIVLSYDGVAIGTSVDSVPELVERIHARRGADGAQLRALRNNLVFVVADEARKEEMRRTAVRRLALLALKRADRLADLAEHQQAKMRELEAGSEHTLAIAIQQCYRHIFYPSRNRIGASGADLDHSAIDLPATSDQPGAGQQQVVRALRELRKLRLAEDEPDSPTYVRDRTPLRRGQMTTLALREEFRRDPALPIMSGDDIFIRGIRRGVEQGDYIYRRGELLCGPGDPAVSIMIDEQAVVLTMEYARSRGIWPRPERDASTQTTTWRQPSRAGARIRTCVIPDRLRQATGGESPPRAPAAVTAEGVLRDALVQLWEKARAQRMEKVRLLSIRMFEAGDAFRLLGAIGAVSGASKEVRFTGGYETRDGGSFSLEFTGPAADAQPVKEFLEPQLRAAQTQDLEVGFALAFEHGLPMTGDAAEKLTDRLSRFASGAAYVSATAEPLA